MQAVPRWFRPVAVGALLWNLLGCFAYLSDVMLTPEALAKMTAAQQALHVPRPMWAVSASAFAVWGGALGSLGLIMRKRWSNLLLVLSLVGVVGQDIGLLTGSVSRTGPAAVVLQGMVLLIAVALMQLGRTASANGWLASPQPAPRATDAYPKP